MCSALTASWRGKSPECCTSGSEGARFRSRAQRRDARFHPPGVLMQATSRRRPACPSATSSTSSRSTSGSTTWRARVAWCPTGIRRCGAAWGGGARVCGSPSCGTTGPARPPPPQCWGVPGQSGNTSVYISQLEVIVQRLVAYAAAHPRAKLLFVSTTPYLCTAQTDTAIVGLNAAAAALMSRYAVPVVDVYAALRAHCGEGVMAGCAKEPSWGKDWCVADSAGRGQGGAQRWPCQWGRAVEYSARGPGPCVPTVRRLGDAPPPPPRLVAFARTARRATTGR